MNDNLSNFQGYDQTLDGNSLSTSRSFVASVFAFMALALVISGIASFWFAASGMVLNLVGDSGLNLLGWVVMLAPLGMVLVMNFAFNRLSYGALAGLFLAYAAVTGISLSFIFLVYDLGTIGKVFFITAALFGTMAVLGYTTKTDLTRMGGILTMALIGIVIASLVNMFMKSSGFDYIISCVGVLVFTGLTAYDVQKIKRIGAGVEYGTAATSKLAIIGALSLYLDFINLFLMLLRVFGGRRD